MRAFAPLLLAAALAAESHPARISPAADFGDQQATGVAIGATGRVFVSFPRWSDTLPPVAVAEVLEGGELRPFPDGAWNAWQPGSAPDAGFVCVQSVFADRCGSLWILDPASPRMAGVVTGGAKLVQIDLAEDRVRRVIRFDPAVAPAQSYLNDLRVSDDQRWAFITDSGLGALVVVDLGTGHARRVLEGHASVRADPDRSLEIDGQPLRQDGGTPRIHSDGIALSPDGQRLYWHALTGEALYRAPTALLTDASASGEALADAVERVAVTGPHDGLAFGPDGWLYLTMIESSAIARFHPADGAIETVIRDPRLSWPDSLAFHPDGSLYVTASQIQRMPRFNEGREARTEPYRLWRIELPH